MFHPVGVAVGDDDVAVVQEPVEEADGGGVFGQEPAGRRRRPPSWADVDWMSDNNVSARDAALVRPVVAAATMLSAAATT